MNGEVEFQDGTTLPISEISRLIPSTAYLGEAHVQVCEVLSDQFEDNDARRVHINTISKKSKRARAITSLLFLARRTSNPAVRIDSDVVDPRFQKLFGDRVTLNFQGRIPRNVLDKFEIVRFVGKALLHCLFRLIGFFFSKKQGPTVIRAWVDSTDNVFGETAHQHPLIIFPFFGNSFRQYRYLKRVYKSKRSFRMAGVPYPVLDIISVALIWDRRDELIVRTELRGYQRLADQFLKNGVKTVFTTDEYEAASCIFHERLMQQGVRSVNHSHGIATYGPYVAYSKFRCHTESQVSFYQLRGHVGQYEIKPFQLAADDRILPDETTYSPTFFYLMGNWRNAGKGFEEDLEWDAIKNLKQLSDQTSIPLLLKPHPNMGQNHRRQMESELGVTIVDTIDEPLQQSNPVFITLLSSAYFDYVKLGPVLVCRNEGLDPTLVYGNRVTTYDIRDTESVFGKFLSVHHWLNEFQNQTAQAESSMNMNWDNKTQAETQNIRR